MRLVQIDDAFVNPEMIKAVFPTSRGSRILMTEGPEIMSTKWPREISDIINPPPAPFDPDDLPF